MSKIVLHLQKPKFYAKKKRFYIEIAQKKSQIGQYQDGHTLICYFFAYMRILVHISK